MSSATIDSVWEMELDRVLAEEALRLVPFAESAAVYARLDAGTRGVVDRVAARVSRVAASFHPDQTAVAVLDASGRGAAEFAALLVAVGDDVPAGWITRADDWLSSRATAWARARAAFLARFPLTPASFDAVVGEARRASGVNHEEAGARLLLAYRALRLGDAEVLCDRALAFGSATPDLRDVCEMIVERAVCVVPGALDGRHAKRLDALFLHGVLIAQRSTRPLVIERCHGLTTTDSGAAPLTVFAAATETCPGCGGPLSHAVDLDLGRADLAFLGQRGSRLRILTCVECTAFGPIYCEVTLDGGARWWRHNVSARPPGREPTPLLDAREMWLTAPVAATESLARIADDQSQLGGYPSWEQDAEYPPCPACAAPMPCIGQLAMQALDFGEGFVYLFLDAACGFAATTFQQT